MTGTSPRAPTTPCPRSPLGQLLHQNSPIPTFMGRLRCPARASVQDTVNNAVILQTNSARVTITDSRQQPVGVSELIPSLPFSGVTGADWFVWERNVRMYLCVYAIINKEGMRM